MDISTSATKELISGSVARNLAHTITGSLSQLRRDKNRDEARLTSLVFSGTILLNARFVGEKPFWDIPNLHHAAPTDRFGNLLVFRGTFDCGGILALNLYFDAISKIYAEKLDLQAAERLLRQSWPLIQPLFRAHRTRQRLPKTRLA